MTSPRFRAILQSRSFTPGFINSGEKQMDILHNNPGMYIKYMAGIEFEKNALRNSLSVYQSYFGNKTVTDMKDFERVSQRLTLKCRFRYV